MFNSVGSVIKNIPLNPKKSLFLSLRVRKAAKDSIGAVFSDLSSEVLSSLEVVSFKNGQLTINTSSLLAAELQMRSERLKEEINKSLGKSLVSSLRLKVK